MSLSFNVSKTQAVDIDASASRTSGVAPLSVHFNADLTASSSTERSFHDLDYSWNFGDPTSGNWGTSGKPKNSDKGPVAAHVYETPGAFTAILIVRDQTGAIVDSETFVINVDDPDVFYAGTNTTCISNDADFTGCPSGATQIILNSLNGIESYVGSGKRILLKRGSSFNADTPLSLGASTTFHLGAFGECSLPDSQQICNNAPQLILSNTLNPFIDLANKHDWRVVDLSLIGTKTTMGLLGGAINIRRLLFLRNTTEGFNTAIGWSHWRTIDDSRVEENAVVGNKMQDMGNTGVFIGADRLAFVGNNAHNSDITHVVRVWWAHLGVISHNQISGSSLTNTNGRAALKLHGPLTGSYSWGACWPYEGQGFIGSFAETHEEGLPYPTKWVVVSDNLFGSSGAWPVSIGPQNGLLDERISDLIFEKNKIIVQYGNSSDVLPSLGVHLEGQYNSVRNNVIDGTGGANGYVGIKVMHRATEDNTLPFIDECGSPRVMPAPPVGINVFNNTIYRSGTVVNGVEGINVAATATGTVVRNNLISFPNESNKTAVDDLSGVSILSNNVMTNSPYFVDPDNANPLLRNFNLTADSTQSIGQGFAVPLSDDFSGNLRTAPYDIGAFEYSSGDTNAPSSPTGLGVI